MRAHSTAGSAAVLPEPDSPQQPAYDRPTQYAVDVLAGSIPAGELVRLACQRHMDDLVLGGERDIIWDSDEAEHAVDFFPAALRHWKGELAGQPVFLEPWQQFIIGSAFGWKKWSEKWQQWIRRYKLVYVEIGKKNGKTLIAGGVGLKLAFFDGEGGADVFSAATKRDQAKLSWLDARMAVKASPDLSKIIGIKDSTSVLYDTRSGSKFEPLGKDSDSSQGINVHGGIIDELHVHADSELWDNIETATASRKQPMRFVITTAGVRRQSIWWDVRQDVLAVVEGRARDDTVFGYIATLDPKDDPWQEANWYKANPNMGKSVFLEDLREAAQRAERSPSRQTAFFRFRLNLPTSASIRGVDMREWEKRPNSDQPRIELGQGCYGGLDLASVKDLTCLILLFRNPNDGIYDVLCRFWCPEEGIAERSRIDGVPYDQWVRDGFLIPTPGDVTDYSYVEKELEVLAEQYAIGEIGYDRWNATQLVTNLTNSGATMTPISQTYTSLSGPWKELERLILDGMLRHGNHPILSWMADNVEIELDPWENVRPSKRKSSERIDGMISLTMAVGRWLTWGDEPGVGYAV